MGWIKLTALLFAIVQLVNGDSIVQTENGPIRGKTVASGKVEAFLGIPYAEPPLGDLRFAKPVPKNSWNDVYDATKLPPSCVQMDFSKFGKFSFVPDTSNMNEDCLYLNIWKPHTKSEDELKAVMLFIHGGGFFMGSSSMELYDGANLADHGDVIVVTINYRVGSLGFFTGFTEDAPGGQGLYDQVMALQWIKDNAKHFHGDPENIVIFGESAGSFSVSMHQISPLSKNLFRRAILQSGSSINPLYSDKNDVVSTTSHAYANHFGCVSNDNTLDKDPESIIQCMRNVPAKKVPEIEMEVFKKGIMILVPRMGNDFIPENTIDMFRKGHFKDSEVLMGITRDEGTLLLAAHRQGLFGLFGMNDVEHIFNETSAYNLLKVVIPNIDTDEGNKIIRSYLDNVNEETGYTYLKAMSEAVGDNIINCGMIFQAEYQSWKNNPVYFYMFDHRTAAAPYAEWMGVPHFDEVQYVFGNPMYQYFTEQEKELSKDIMDMWTTFARTGNPNIPGSVTWPRYTYEDPKFYIIGKRDSVGTRPDNYRCEAWRDRYRSTIDESVIEALKKH